VKGEMEERLIREREGRGEDKLTVEGRGEERRG
jgi:hypothetical protein